MQNFLLDYLQCPACGGELTWEIEESQGSQVEAATARCQDCAVEYPVRDGIGLFLTPDLPRNDMWAQAETGLEAYLRERPDVQRQLMETPLHELSPADQFFRAQFLEAQGDFERAQPIFDQVQSDLYVPETLICFESQLHYLMDHLKDGDGPVVDLASGRMDLAAEMARNLNRPLVATDFSPTILRRNRRWLAHAGLSERVSLLAFDARCTPFKDGAVTTLTSNQGLINIQEPGKLLAELRRIVSGQFLSIHLFYPPEDDANREAIEELKLSDLLFRAQAQRLFLENGWSLQLKNICLARALPTPASQLLEEAGIDSLPVSETELEWTTLVAM